MEVFHRFFMFWQITYLRDDKCTSMNVCNTFSKKQIDFKAKPLMFLDLASPMKSLYSTSQQYLHKTERTFPSSVSFLKSFANGYFFRDTWSIRFLSNNQKKKEWSPLLILYNKLEEICLSIYKDIHFMHIRFYYFTWK